MGVDKHFTGNLMELLIFFSKPLLLEVSLPSLNSVNDNSDRSVVQVRNLEGILNLSLFHTTHQIHQKILMDPDGTGI